jgi:hypothetical protein
MENKIFLKIWLVLSVIPIVLMVCSLNEYNYGLAYADGIVFICMMVYYIMESYIDNLKKK